MITAATAASALSLGRSRGAVLLGRGFDVTVLASVEPQESTPEANCFFPEVFYGDSRVSPSQVSVSVDRASPSEVRVRVRAASAVDEPIVTLYLRSTCGGNNARRYVLLADSPSEGESSNAPVVVPFVQPGGPQAAPPARAGGSASTEAAPTARSTGQARTGDLRTSEQAQAAREQRRAERQARLQARREAAAAAPRSAEPVKAPPASAATLRSTQRLAQQEARKTAGQPRLKIDLTDLTGAREPSLRTSSELLSAPSQDANIRAQAMALWNSLNAGPDEALREAQRVQALEAQLKQSLEQGKRQGQEITDLTTQLKEAKRSRYLNPFTALLALLTLLGIGATLWLLKRGATFSTANKPWWGTEKRDKEEQKLWEHLDDGQATGAAPLSADRVLPAGGAKLGGASKITYPSKTAALSPQSFRAQNTPSLDQASGNSIQPDFDLSGADMSEPAGASPAKSNANKRGANSGFSISQLPSTRVADAEELFDIQEQADFFLSLGQPDQAIEVLTNHISDNVETSALAYMDLFDIYHRYSRESDYNQLREEFNRVFNAQVPVFSKYNVNPRGLEDYPLALKSIQELWPSSGVMEVIEESIFRKPDNDSKPFDMLAYRELMLLYSLAKEIGSSSFVPLSSTPLGPLSTSTATEMAGLEPLPSDMLSLQAQLLDGDVNFSLDEPVAKTEQTISLTPAQTAKLASQAGMSAAPSRRADDDNSLDFDLSDFGSANAKDADDALESDDDLERQLRSKLGQPGKKTT